MAPVQQRGRTEAVAEKGIMSLRGDNERPERKNRFLHRRVHGEVESICMRCFGTLHAGHGKSLDLAEHDHEFECPALGGSPEIGENGSVKIRPM